MSARPAFYLRLSMADGDLGKDGKDESNSIENQRELLRCFVETREELAGEEIIEYVDDGYSGVDFKRPAFRRMIDDAKKGVIDTILVKDLSRLGRDYIGVGDYLEQIFPVLGIRFIAVNSNYDSSKYVGRTMGLDMAVSNLVNALYSRDISKKVKAGIHTRWNQGISTTGRPPYGYIKDNSAVGGWRVDDEAAEVVKTIFEKAATGWTSLMIAGHLNENNIDTPSLHREKLNQFGGKRKVADSECLWDASKINKIIHRYEYTGAFVQNQRESMRVGSHITRAVPKHKQVVIENGHEAIISAELYEKAQLSIKFMSTPKFKTENNYPLRGKMRCGTCKLALNRVEHAYDAVYFCSHKSRSGRKSKCCDKHMSASEIDSAVYRALKSQLRIVREIGLRLKDSQKKTSADNADIIRRLEKEAEILKAERIRQYEAYADGVISRDNYLAKREKLTVEIDDIQKKLDGLHFLTDDCVGLTDEIEEIDEKAERFESENALSKEAAQAFIQTVYVYDEKTIEVEFTFDDLIRRANEKLAEV